MPSTSPVNSLSLIINSVAIKSLISNKSAIGLVTKLFVAVAIITGPSDFFCFTVLIASSSIIGLILSSTNPLRSSSNSDNLFSVNGFKQKARKPSISKSPS